MDLVLLLTLRARIAAGPLRGHAACIDPETAGCRAGVSAPIAADRWNGINRIGQAFVEPRARGDRRVRCVSLAAAFDATPSLDCAAIIRAKPAIDLRSVRLKSIAHFIIIIHNSLLLFLAMCALLGALFSACLAHFAYCFSPSVSLSRISRREFRLLHFRCAPVRCAFERFCSTRSKCASRLTVQLANACNRRRRLQRFRQHLRHGWQSLAALRLIGTEPEMRDANAIYKM